MGWFFAYSPDLKKYTLSCRPAITVLRPYGHATAVPVRAGQGGDVKVYCTFITNIIFFKKRYYRLEILRTINPFNLFDALLSLPEPCG